MAKKKILDNIKNKPYFSKERPGPFFFLIL
jgi:hypothetical protein